MTNNTTKNNEWFCQICGSSYMDEDEKQSSLEKHALCCHNLDLESYNHLVNTKIGASHLKVKLLNYPNEIALPIVSFLSQTWGPTFDLEDFSDDDVQEMLNIALEGKSLSTALECMQFTFQIDGLSRASSHQLVRVRIGSGFSQKGMSDAYYGDAEYVTPAAIVAAGKEKEYKEIVEKSIELYDELFKAGVTYQDARFVLPHAMTTSLIWTVNYLALKNFCGKRMQRSQSWEMNMLCQLLKQELAKVYPKLANGLKPFCEYSHKCQSFGNLFEGCGKYHLEKKHDRYVFSSEQILHNLKFDDERKKKNIIHNMSVKPKNNHFLLLAQERQNITVHQGYGRFASSIHKTLQSYKSYEYSDTGLLFDNHIYPTFLNIHNRYQAYENGNGDYNKDIDEIRQFNADILSLSCTLLGKNVESIICDIWELHTRKNKEYNDGWYFDGIRGVIKDLHRKIHRLKVQLSLLNTNYDSLQNTLYDTLLYGVFLETACNENLPLKGNEVR